MADVKFSSVSKAFGSTRVLDDVRLDVADGEFITLLGPSGCGKSTLLRILAGLEAADDGDIHIGRVRVNDARPKARDVAMVFQSYALYPHMSVAANLMLPLRMRHLSLLQRMPIVGKLMPGTRSALKEIEADVARTATAIGIDHLLARKPGQLSGGQRQRVAVGRAMVRRPSVFLMDEPLSNLDAKLRVQMRAEIKELHRKLGVTFIYVTHDQSEAMTMSDRVAIMLEGRLQQVAPPEEIYSNPNSRQVAEFIGSPKINLLEALIDENGVVSIGASCLGRIGERATPRPIHIGIRPEALSVTDDPTAAVVSGTVSHVEDMGPDLFVYLLANGQSELIVYRASAGNKGSYLTGARLNLTADFDRLLMFETSGRRLYTSPTSSTRLCA